MKLPSFKFKDPFSVFLLFSFHLLILTVPFFFTWFNEELFEFNKIILLYAFTVFISTAWIARMIAKKKFKFQKTIFDLPILLFVCSQLISTLFSIHPHTSIFGYYTRFHGGLLSTFSYVILFYAFVNNIERKHLFSLLRTTLISAGVIALSAIPEHFGYSFTCLLIKTSMKSQAIGMQAWSLTELQNAFDISQVSCWVQDVINRVFTTFGQPNWLAAYVITLLPLSIALAVQDVKERSTKTLFDTFLNLFPVLLFGGISTLLFLTLQFTKSRSGFLGLAIGLALFIFGLILLKVREGKKFTQAIFWKTLAISFCLLIALNKFGTPFTPTFQPAPPKQTEAVNRLEEGGTDSGEIRKIVWQGAIQVWKRYPLFGSGVETFAYSYYLDRPLAHNAVSEWDFLFNKAHNELLNFLATTGIFGLSSYLFMVGMFVISPVVIVFFPQVNLIKKFFPHQLSLSEKIIFLSLSAGLVALSISNVLGFSTVMVTILLFIFPAMCIVLTKNELVIEQQPLKIKKKNMSPLSEIQSAEQTFTGTQVIEFLGVALVTLFLLISTMNLWRADQLYTAGKQAERSGEAEKAISLMEKARSLNPGEGLFYDELSILYANYAVAYAQLQEATLAAQLSRQAISLSDTLLQMNPVHLNFYKSRVRFWLIMSQINPRALEYAQATLVQARKLAPNDPKLAYNLGLVLLNEGKTEEGIKTLEEAIQLKPNYATARTSLAAEYENHGDYDKAKQQYEYILQKISPDDKVSAQKLESVVASMSAEKKKK